MSPSDKLDSISTPEAQAPRKNPGELGLGLSPAVLRIPYTIGTRMVLAEIISLHQSNPRGCDASDRRFADRLYIAERSATRAVAELCRAKLISKTVDKAAGFYRVLVPHFEAIEAAASLNPYPEHQGRPKAKLADGEATPILADGGLPPNWLMGGATPKLADGGATANLGVAISQNGGSPSANLGVAHQPIWGTNTTLNTTPNITVNSHSASLPSAALDTSEGQKKIGREISGNQLVDCLCEEGSSVGMLPNIADHELVTAAKSVALAKKRAAWPAGAPARPAELLPDSCPLAELLNPGGDAARVQLLDEPLTEKQACALLNEFSEPALRDIFCQMANWGKLLTPAGATSANLTARNWLNKQANARKADQSGAVQHLAGRPGGMSGGFHRSPNSTKPTGDAGAFARAFAERQ